MFFLGSGEKNVVEYQSVSGGVGVERQVRWRIAYKVAVVLRIVAAVESPEAIAVVVVDVSRLGGGLVLTHDEHIGLDVTFEERRALAHEAFNGAGVTLGEHGRHGIPFGGKVEECKIVLFRQHISTHVVVNRRVLIRERIFDELEIFESEGLAEV